MKGLVFLCGCMLTSSSCLAQAADSVVNISTIKRDTSYIYAEATMKDAVEAQSGARAILEIKVGDWVRSQHPNEVVEYCVARARENWADLQTRRGNYNRVLVYVKKSDIIPITDSSEVVVFKVDSVMKAEEPRYELSADEEDMAAVLTFESIEPYVKKLKSNGRLHAYGKYASLPEDSPCHLFVYDRDGLVVATLRQTEDGRYVNLLTLKEDHVRNYKNCGAIWFQLKQQEQ